jgi:hypothetical protein
MLNEWPLRRTILSAHGPTYRRQHNPWSQLPDLTRLPGDVERPPAVRIHVGRSAFGQVRADKMRTISKRISKTRLLVLEYDGASGNVGEPPRELNLSRDRAIRGRSRAMHQRPDAQPARRGRRPCLMAAPTSPAVAHVVLAGLAWSARSLVVTVPQADPGAALAPGAAIPARGTVAILPAVASWPPFVIVAAGRCDRHRERKPEEPAHPAPFAIARPHSRILRRSAPLVNSYRGG